MFGVLVAKRKETQIFAINLKCKTSKLLPISCVWCVYDFFQFYCLACS